MSDWGGVGRIRALTITPRWFVRRFGLLVFVGIPLVWGAGPRAT
jgi:hypothetical protein